MSSAKRTRQLWALTLGGCTRAFVTACITFVPAVVNSAFIAVRSTPYGDFGEAIEAAQPGDILYLLPGVHRARDARLLDNLFILGDSPADTAIQCEYYAASGFLAEGIRGVVIEGVSIYGGRGHQAYPGATPKGGGLLCRRSGVTIRNCVIARCDIRDSSYHGQGGAIYAENGSRLTIEDCVFRDNAAEYGSAILTSYTSAGPGSSLTMRRWIVESNYAGQNGSTLDLWGRGEVVLEDCRIMNNIAGLAGAVTCSDAPLRMNRCLVANNISRDGPRGALSIGGNYDVGLTDCVIANNMVKDGAMSGFVAGAGVSGAGRLTLTNCTIVGNTVLELSDEDVIRRGGGLWWTEGSVKVRNCIFWGNTEDISRTEVELDIAYCNIEDMFPGEGVMHVEPRFVDPENGDFRLLGDSPCIDRGTDDPAIVSNTDIEGKPRLLFGGVAERPDLGAYEYDPSLPLQIYTQSLERSIADHEYRTDLKVTGGFGPYSWFLLSGSLPRGLDLSRDGVLSGTPAVPGSYDFTVLVASLQGPAEERSYQPQVSGYRNWYVDASVGSSGDGSSSGAALATI
jgi:hypothetical protein